MTTSELIDLVNTFILSGGKRTKAQPIRENLMPNIFNSFPNVEEGGNVFLVEVGYSSDLLIADDFSFVHKKWVLENAIGFQKLSEVLSEGNETGVNNIVITEGSAIQTITGNVQLYIQDTPGLGNLTASETSNASYADVGVNKSGSAYIESFDGINTSVLTVLGTEINISSNSIFGTSTDLLSELVVSNTMVQLSRDNVGFSSDGSANYISGQTRFTSLTALTVPYLGPDKELVSSSVTPSELDYLSGVTSPVQTQLNALQTGLKWKAPARVAVFTNVNIASPGVSLDSIALSANDVVLLAGETLAETNGLYVWNGAAVPMTRTTDADTNTKILGMVVNIMEGTYADKGYTLATDAPIVLNTTPLTFQLWGGTSYIGTVNRITVSGNVIDIGTDVVILNSTQTLTNKRITKRITTITSSATPTVNTDTTDHVKITALAEAITSMTTNLSGTPTEAQLLWYQIKDNGTARAITWGASFEAKGQALPTTTTLNKRINVLFSWDAVTSKWGCLDAIVEA